MPKGLEDALDYLDDNFFELDDECQDIFKRIVQAVGCRDASELKPDKLLKPKIKKEDLVNWLDEIFDHMKRARQALRVAEATIDKLQKDALEDKANIVSLQSVVIQKQREQLSEVSATVQNEMKSYCDIVKTNCSNVVVTPDRIKSVVKSVNEEDDRSKNILVFGLKEEEKENLTAVVSDLIESVGEKPKIQDCIRIGGGNNKESCRPVKVMLSNSDTAHHILRRSSKLRGVVRHRNVFLAPDRSSEERASHKALVDDIKKKMKTDPSKYHYIKNNVVVSVPKIEKPKV